MAFFLASSVPFSLMAKVDVNVFYRPPDERAGNLFRG